MKHPNNESCAELNRRYGAPGRIVFRPSADTLAPVAVLVNKYGTCEIDLLGARVISYRPTGQSPVLFTPKSMKPTEPAGWTHGGIPVCWPWFGRNGEEGTPSHGMVRAQVFTPLASEYSDDATELTLVLESDELTKKSWPYDFELKVKISVSMSLNVTLTAKNTGTEKFWITEGFHPYFLVRDASKCRVHGVEGAEYCDTVTFPAPFTAKSFTAKWQGELTTAGEWDHVFSAPDGEYALFDPGLKRTIVIRSRGNKKLIVWRPSDEYDGQNMEKGDNARMVCVEPATLFRDEGYYLEPGASHELRMAVQCDPQDGSVHSRN